MQIVLRYLADWTFSKTICMILITKSMYENSLQEAGPYSHCPGQPYPLVLRLLELQAMHIHTQVLNVSCSSWHGCFEGRSEQLFMTIAQTMQHHSGWPEL